jgi:Uncharacterized conserved protein
MNCDKKLLTIRNSAGSIGITLNGEDQMKSIVSIVKKEVGGTQQSYTQKNVDEVREMLDKVFLDLGGIESLISHGDKIVIKPNLVEVPYPRTAGSVLTDPRVLEALCSILKDYGVGQVLVGEGKSVNLKHCNAGARQAFEKTGLAAAARRGGAEIIAWDEEEFVPVKDPKLMLWDQVMVPKSLVECDYFINLPKLKTHGQSEITCAIKSMQGVYRTEDKIQFHTECFPWKMCDMLRVAKPDLNIVDGLIAGEGFGPIYTEPVPLNIILGSTDVVATDAVVSKIMDIEPWEVPITRLAATEGFGEINLDNIEVKGTPIEEVACRFKRPALWNPIGFSDKLKVIAGGASRFEMAQVAATCKRLEWDGTLEKMKDEVYIFIGDMPPMPKRPIKNVIICGDAAIRDVKLDGIKIPGNPPLPSVQIVQAIEKLMAEGKC